MRFGVGPFLLGAALLVAAACSGVDNMVIGTGASSSSSSASASASSTVATVGTTSTTAGTGGAGATTGTGGMTGTGGGEPPLQPSGFSCSGAMPSINAVVAITSVNCATSKACHLGDGTAAGVYNSYVNVLSEECTDGRLFVKPSDPEHSYVINKITNHNLCAKSVAMPNGGTPLASTDIQTIYDWICSGAPDK